MLGTHVSKEALDYPFRAFADYSKTPFALPTMDSLRGTGDLASTVKIVLRAMLESGENSAERLAHSAGLSLRTFQRQLSNEGTSYSQLLKDVKYEAAMDWLELDEGSLGELALSLGYSNPSAFSRAMRNWAGASPRELAKRVNGGSQND